MKSVQPVLNRSYDTLVNGDGSSPDGTHAMYCILIKSKAILLAVISLTTIMMITSGSFHFVLADPLHCDIQGWPSCYGVGYSAGWY
jgi:hypothetical protein